MSLVHVSRFGATGSSLCSSVVANWISEGIGHGGRWRGCKRLQAGPRWAWPGLAQDEGVSGREGGGSAIRWTARLLDLRACAAKGG